MRPKLIRVGLLVYLANHYTARSAKLLYIKYADKNLYYNPAFPFVLSRVTLISMPSAQQMWILLNAPPARPKDSHSLWLHKKDSYKYITTINNPKSSLKQITVFKLKNLDFFSIKKKKKKKKEMSIALSFFFLLNKKNKMCNSLNLICSLYIENSGCFCCRDTDTFSFNVYINIYTCLYN